MFHITINKKPLTFQQKNNEFHLPTLYSTSKLNQELKWNIYVIDNQIFRKKSINDNKITEYPPTICFPKNVGKKNETTEHHQALFQAYSMWEKKKDQGCCENIQNIPKTVYPMLANKYTDRGQKYLKEPFAISRKIDGIRLISQFRNQQLFLTSRNGKTFHFMNNIRQELQIIFSKFPQIILDGEVYSHDIDFRNISGAVRCMKEPSEFDDQLEYWIFDVVCADSSYQNRIETLRDIFSNNEFQFLKLVDYELVTHNQVEPKHQQYVSEGFEGVICRNLDSKYKQKYRSNDLLKHKTFQDDEFKIVDIVSGTGTEKDCAIYVCETVEKELFNVRPRGSFEVRQRILKNKKQFINKLLTVRHQSTKGETIPRFPVGIEVRDYE